MANMRHGFQNTELIDKTIASIKSKARFTMSDWCHCICGHMARVEGVDTDAVMYEGKGPSDWGRAKLGLSQSQMILLFGEHHATRAEAVRALEILRDIGVVDWDQAKAEVLDERLAVLRARMPKTLEAAEAYFDQLVAKAKALV